MRSETGRAFIERTKHKYLGPSDQQLGRTQPPLEAPFEGEGRVLELPDPGGVASDLKKWIDGRRSVREYAETPLSLAELSHLLWCTQGVQAADGANWTLRTVPSAGARHALETFVLVNRVEGLAPGVYRYLALEHRLGEFLLDEGLALRIARACLGQAFVLQSAATFVWAAAVERMTWRYHERGYRYLFLDAGHVCQNLYLASEAIGCGVCAIAAYDDDVMNALLQLDGEDRFVVYLATIGKKRG